MSREAVLSSVAEDGWYVVLDGEQIGPISRDALVAHVEKGVADGQTYVWRQGFDEWKRMTDDSNLSQLVAVAQPVSGGGEVDAAALEEVDDSALPSTAAAESSLAASGNDLDERTTVVPMGSVESVADLSEPGFSEDDWDPTLVEQERPLEVQRSIDRALAEQKAQTSGQSDLDRTTLVPSGALADASAKIAASGGTLSADDAAASVFSDEPSSSSAGGGGFFDVGDSSRSEPSMSHQRRETSVLFSLDDVSPGDSGGPSPAGGGGAGAFAEAKTESGLIDIRAVARNQSGGAAASAGGSNLFNTGAPAAAAGAALETRIDAKAAPLVQRKKKSGGSSAPLWIMAFAVLGAVGFGIWYMMTQMNNQPAETAVAEKAPAAAVEVAPKAAPAEQPANAAPPEKEAGKAPPANTPPANADAAANNAPPANAAADAAAAAAAPPGENGAAAEPAGANGAAAVPENGAAAEAVPKVDAAGKAEATAVAKAAANEPAKTVKSTTKKTRKESSKKAKINSKSTKVKAAAAAKKPEKAVAVTPKKEVKSGEATALLNLLDNPKGGSAPASPSGAAAAKPKSNLPEKLSPSDIRKAMRKHYSAVQNCYQSKMATKPEGAVTATAKLVVSGKGRVSSARVTGPVAGTPAASCIEKRLMTASFPEFGSPTQSVTVPLRLQ